MHILVTGGCGYVGTPLTEALLKDGHEVTVIDSQWFGNHLLPSPGLRVIKHDVRDVEGISMAGVSAIVHLANIANDPCVDLDPRLSWEVNTLATMRLADKAARSGVRQFIYASSGSVYGVKEEPQVTEKLTTDPISEYNKTKMVSDRVILSYSQDMAVQCIRPATVCGYSPRMRLDLSVNLLTMQALVKKEITVLGGDQVRPNIHIKDMVSVYQHFLRLQGGATGVFNAGFENLSIMEIAKLVSGKLNAKITVKDSNDPRSYRLNSDKLLATGFQPQFGISHGIAEVTQAFHCGLIKDEDQYYNIRWMKNTVLRPPV